MLTFNCALFFFLIRRQYPADGVIPQWVRTTLQWDYGELENNQRDHRLSTSGSPLDCLFVVVVCLFFTSFSNSYSKFQFNVKDSICYKKSILNQCLISNVCFIGNQSSAGKNWWQIWLADTTPRRHWREFIDRYHMSNARWVFPVSHTLYIVPKRSYFLEAGSSNSCSSERLEWN